MPSTGHVYWLAPAGFARGIPLLPEISDFSALFPSFLPVIASAVPALKYTEMNSHFS
jgi:hypothetical protein